MSWLDDHRELEYLRSVGSVPKKHAKKQRIIKEKVRKRDKKRGVGFGNGN